MKIASLSIPEVLLIEPKKFGDHRGFFSETFREDLLKDKGFVSRFVQDNHSLSAKKGTLRGLHFQRPPHAQDKLVRVARGSILDVAVDVRTGSPTFGQHVTAKLSADNGHQLLVPKGFAHAFLTLEDDTEVLYKCSDYYAPDCDGGIIWKDAEVGVCWDLDGEPILSEKDSILPLLSELPSDLFPYGQF